MFPKAAKKDQQIILIVVSLFLIIIPFIDIARLGQVGSPGAEEVLSIVEKLTDLTPPLVVDLTELDGHIIKVFQGHLLRFKDLPVHLSTSLPVLNVFNHRLCPNTQSPPNQTVAS